MDLENPNSHIAEMTTKGMVTHMSRGPTAGTLGLACLVSWLGWRQKPGSKKRVEAAKDPGAGFRVALTF